MSFVVVYDANVLYGSIPRDLLIRVAQAGLVQAKWTHTILDEVFDNLVINRPELDRERLSRTRQLMLESVRDCLIEDYEPLVEVVELPDKNDRHVLAAAIKARAQVIVTNNLGDFPSDVLARWDIEPKTADAFLADQVHLDKSKVFGAIQRMADAYRNPPMTTDDLIRRLDEQGLVETVAALRI
ncbi:putative nucleic acid-binding protein [Actinopolyspora lacussalsi]|nr:putative nucleic acid-binding protein [Actinopolyspora lacussalsi]